MPSKSMNIRYFITENNCHIVESFRVKSRADMVEFCKNLPERFLQSRSVNSYVREWRAHNLLYDLHIKRERTQDCDLNTDEPLLKRVCYFVLSLFYFH